MLGVIYLGMGRWDDARKCFDEVPSIAGGNREAVRLAAYRAAELDLLEGYPERALDRLDPLLEGDTASYDALLVSAHLAWADAVLGNSGRAATLADETVRRARFTESRLCLVEVLSACGATLVELQHWDAAAQTLAEGLALAREIHHVPRQAVIVLLQARLCQRRGQTAAALDWLRQGREQLSRLGGARAASVAELYAGMAQPAPQR